MWVTIVVTIGSPDSPDVETTMDRTGYKTLPSVRQGDMPHGCNMCCAEVSKDPEQEVRISREKCHR